jgi:hypothetical protein
MLSHCSGNAVKIGSLARRSLTPVAIAALYITSSHAVLAQISITGAQTTPISTSTANKGSPDDVVITTTGSIALTSGTAAVTLDSNNNVTNEGSISLTGVNNASGILILGGVTGSVTVDGTISLTDTTVSTAISPTTGSLTGGSMRYGIQVQGSSPFIGSITEVSGATIGVRGNDSAAILVTPGISAPSGTTDAISLSGTVGATGNDSYGLQTIGPVNGGILLAGTVSAVGKGSTAVSLGTVNGAVSITGAVEANGYWYDGVETTVRPYPIPTNLNPGNEEQGGSALSFAGSVTGGISVVSGSTITSLGSAPTIVINGTAGAVAAIGLVSGGSYGLQLDGDITTSGIYDKIATTAIQVGGAGGGGASIAGGIQTTAKVTATSYAANATAFSFQTGAQSTSLDNTGTITATVNFGAGANAAVGGTATAIFDGAGALASITNTGTIKAATQSGSAVAMDLSANTTGVTVTQSAPSSTTASAPSITGDILFGSGNATLNVDAGSINGGVSFGSGANALTIDNGARLTGAVTETGGAIALGVLDGRLTDTSAATLNLSSLTLGSAGQVDFAVNPATGQNGAATVLGAVVISSGAKIGLDFDSKLIAPETFTVIQASSAGALSGQPSLLLGEVPYFYVANLATDSAAGVVSIGVRDRTFAEAGVAGNAAAYKAIFGAFDRDSAVENTFNSASTQQAFKQVYQQSLPNYSGGLFEMLQNGSQALVRAETDSPIALRGDRSGGWAQQIGFGATDGNSGQPGYHGGGLGFAFGWEDPVSTISSIGYTVAYMRGSINDAMSGPDDHQVGTVYSGGVYWRETDGNFHATASLNAGVAELNGQRNFAGVEPGNVSFTKTATSNWTGGTGQAHLGVDYEQPIGDGFFVRPGLMGDYFLLYEGAHGEHNGGNAFNLNYASAFGKQGSASGLLTFGMRFGDQFIWRPEMTVGWKQVFGGPDSVNAQFASGGSSFTLSPQSQKGGALARLGIHGGDKYTDLAFEAGGEERGDYRAFDGQLVARFKF